MRSRPFFFLKLLLLLLLLLLAFHPRIQFPPHVEALIHDDYGPGFTGLGSPPTPSSDFAKDLSRADRVIGRDNKEAPAVANVATTTSSTRDLNSYPTAPARTEGAGGIRMEDGGWSAKKRSAYDNYGISPKAGEQGAYRSGNDQADLERMVRQVFIDMMSEKEKEMAAKLIDADESKEGGSRSSSEQEDRDARKYPQSSPELPKQQPLPSLEALDQNGRDLVALLKMMEGRFPNKQLAERTLKLANTLIQTSKGLYRTLNSSAPVGAKELEKNRSFVVIGIAESNKRKASDRLAEDWRRVVKILDTFGIEASPQIVYRVARDTQQSKDQIIQAQPTARPRAIKVVMPTALFRIQVVLGFRDKWGELRRIKGFENSIIRRWLNKKQQKRMKVARAKLEELRRKGVKNLVIRNFQVVRADEPNRPLDTAAQTAAREQEEDRIITTQELLSKKSSRNSRRRRRKNKVISLEEGATLIA